MDFERGAAAEEAERRAAEAIAAEADAIAALPALDAAARRRVLVAVQRALRGGAVAARLAVARASPALLLAADATAQLAAIVRAAGGEGLPAGEAGALARGERVGAVALADEAGAPAARLVRGGGAWRLAARKAFVTNGPDADWIAVFADADGREAIALVSPRDEGVVAGPAHALLGLDGLAVGALAVDGPAARVLGPFEARAASARYACDADLSCAIAAAGLMRGVLGAATRHAHGHVRGGRPAFTRQEVAFQLADVLALTEAAELLCHRAAWAVEVGDPGAAALVRCAKVFCAESAERAASAALQVMGGEGYRRGSAAERAWRDAKGLALAGTTTEVSRMAIADALLAR